MAKQMSKAEVRAMAEQAAEFEKVWDDAIEQNELFDAVRKMNAELEAQEQAEREALEAPVGGAVWAPATTVAPTTTNAPEAQEPALPPVLQAAAQGTPVQRYSLNGPAMQLASQGHNAGATLQKSGDPKLSDPNWRSNGHKATNTRAIALATIVQELGSGFAAAEAQACLAKWHKAGALHLGSGTPASYVKAFIKNGYFAPVTVAVEQAQEA